jgi:glycosyltransferase involved in cell wall biosynthesis
MQYLASLGWNIGIVRIRGKVRPDKSATSGIYLFPVMLNPVHWVQGLAWALKYRRLQLRDILKQVNGKSNIKTKLKLLVIVLTTLGIAEYIQTRQLSFDHIRAHFLHSEALIAYWLSLLTNIPYSITVHTRMIYFPLSMVSEIARNAMFCVGISNETVDFAKQLRHTQQGVYLIRNGVEFEELEKKEKTISSTPVILAVGRLVPKKGFDVLIKACATLKTRFDFNCMIIGDGSEFSSLKNLITENCLSEFVQLIGALSFDDVVSHYQIATVLVVPSRICNNDVDGLPTVIIEALAMGTPVIASSIAGIPDLIKHKETGMIVPPDNEKALAEALTQLLLDRKLRDKLANQGKQVVADEFDIAKTIKRLDNLIALNLADPTQRKHPL